MANNLLDYTPFAWNSSVVNMHVKVYRNQDSNDTLADTTIVTAKTSTVIDKIEVSQILSQFRGGS